MQFYEKLTELMEQHDVRSKDLYPRLNVNKSRFSKIKNGSFLPDSLLMIEKMAGIMRLDSGEYEELLNSWINSKYSSNFEKTSKLIHRFYRITAPLEPVTPTAEPQIENETMLTGKECVIRAAMQMMSGETISVLLDFIPDSDLVCENMRRILTALHSKVSLHWLLSLDNRNSNSIKNLELFINAIPIMLQHKMKIRSTYLHTEEHQEALFPGILITSKAVLLFSRDMECAMLLRNAEICKQYEMHFSKRFDQAREQFRIFDDIADFLEMGTSVFGNTLPEIKVFYIIDKYPCIINYVTGTDIKGHISQNYEESDRLLGRYISFLSDYQRFVSGEYTLFWQQGLYDMMTAETHYVYPKSVCKSLPKMVRRTAVEKLAHSLQKENIFHAGIIRKPFPKGTLIHAVNLFTDGKCILMFNIQEHMKLLVFEEADILKTVLQYVQILKDVGIISSTQETVQEIEQMLAKTDGKHDSQV